MNFEMLPFFREPMKKRFVFIFRIITVFTEHNEKRRLFPAIEGRVVSIVNTDMGKLPFIPLPALPPQKKREKAFHNPAYRQQRHKNASSYKDRMLCNERSGYFRNSL